MLGLLKDLRRRAVNRLADAISPPLPPVVDFDEDKAPFGEGESELERVRRQRDEYFEVISRIEKERDELWHMYRVQVSEHLNAQGLLSKERARLIRMLAKTVQALNQMRKDKGLEPIKGPAELGISPATDVGQIAERYIHDMIRLCESAPKRLEEARPFGRKKTKTESVG